MICLHRCTTARPRRHREERSDAAIQKSTPDGADAQTAVLDCFVAALLAMTFNAPIPTDNVRGCQEFRGRS